MTIKGKGPFSGNRIPQKGTARPVRSKAQADAASPTQQADAGRVDRFEDTAATRTYSDEAGFIHPNSRPSAKRSFHKLVAKTERKIVAEHGQLQGEVESLLQEMRAGKDVSGDLAPLRNRLGKLRRRLATLRRRRAQMDVQQSQLQPDLRLGLELVGGTAAKVAHVAQLKPAGVEVFDAPEDAQKAATEFAKGGRSARVTRFLLQTLTGDAGPEAKADLDHPRAAELDQIDAALIG